MEWLRRPEVSVDALAGLFPDLLSDFDIAVREQVEIQAKYTGYIERQQAEIDRARRYEHWRLPQDMDYGNVVGLSNEVRDKLQHQQPETVGQAARISGMTPAAVTLLIVHLKKSSA
jgi:tRNA uridine 5-carboxymethylaminomethyl modification enzyme